MSDADEFASCANHAIVFFELKNGNMAVAVAAPLSSDVVDDDVLVFDLLGRVVHDVGIADALMERYCGDDGYDHAKCEHN